MQKEQSEILLQSADDGVLQRKGQYSRNELCRHAAGERAHSTCSWDGLAWGAGTGCCLGLGNGCCCSANQDSRQQETAAAFATESQADAAVAGGDECNFPI